MKVHTFCPSLDGILSSTSENKRLQNVGTKEKENEGLLSLCVHGKKLRVRKEPLVRASELNSQLKAKRPRVFALGVQKAELMVVFKPRKP